MFANGSVTDFDLSVEMLNICKLDTVTEASWAASSRKIFIYSVILKYNAVERIAYNTILVFDSFFCLIVLLAEWIHPITRSMQEKSYQDN